MSRKGGISGHVRGRRSDDWMTPRELLADLGEFDLDPCESAQSVFPPIGRRTYTIRDDGLAQPWSGRVFLNPPYSRVGLWMSRLASHPDGGTALVFARTETQWFQQTVFGAATGLLFVPGRLRFRRPDGTAGRYNCGGPVVFVAYGVRDYLRLCDSRIAGQRLLIRG